MARFAGRQGGGRFVEDQDARVERQRLADFDELLLGDAELADLCRQIDLDAQAGEDGLRLAAHGLFRQQAQAIAQFAPEEDIFHRVQIGDQRKFLEDDGDAGGDGVVIAVKLACLAVDHDAARVGPVNAAENFHQGGLASAVLAQQGVDLAGRDRQADAVQGFDTREALGDML